MVKNNKKPRLRFKGFTDEWEQRKVSDLLNERNIQQPQSQNYPLMAFIANEGVSPKGERYDRSSLVNDNVNKLYKTTEKGDFIYSSNNLETGSIGLNNYGNATISPVYSIFYPTEIADSEFIGRRLVRKDFINEMVKWRQGVIYGQWRIHESDFLKINILIPQKDEQIKIGKILANLDDLITLHQRKYDKLLNVKKALLDKMFPKNQEKTPKIRFKGFFDAWEQRKVSDLAYRYDNLRLPITAKDRISGRTPYYGANGIQDYVQGFTHEGEFVLIAEDGANDIKNYPVQYVNGQIWVNNHAHVLQANENNITLFIKYLITSSNIASILVGGGRSKLNSDALMNFEISIPIKQEQQKIAKLFLNLDNLITLHQSKCEKLKNIKKALLDKMFV